MTTRPKEASDSQAGYHQFHNDDGEPYGSFEVFWDDGYPDEDAPTITAPGWYWWACFPGCLPDGDPAGPFDTSSIAREDADPEWDFHTTAD